MRPTSTMPGMEVRRASEVVDQRPRGHVEMPDALLDRVHRRFFRQTAARGSSTSSAQARRQLCQSATLSRFFIYVVLCNGTPKQLLRKFPRDKLLQPVLGWNWVFIRSNWVFRGRCCVQ